MAVTPEIQLALDELRATFVTSEIRIQETGDGGAWVEVNPVALGGPFEQQSTSFGFLLSFQYPAADVYPHFVRPDLSRRDGGPLGQAFQSVNWGPEALAGIQVSRATRQVNPEVDTAALKLLKVIAFMETT